MQNCTVAGAACSWQIHQKCKIRKSVYMLRKDGKPVMKSTWVIAAYSHNMALGTSMMLVSK